MKKLLLIIFTLFLGVAMFAQDCSDLFISEYVEGSGNNKAIEIYNPTSAAIDLGNYNLVRYSNGGFVPYDVGLAGIIESRSTYVVVLDKRDPNGVDLEQPVDTALQMKADTFLCPVYNTNRMMYFNGNDAVTLEKKTGEIVDVVGLIGPPMTKDDNGWGSLNDTTIVYNSGGNPTEYTIENYIVGPLFWLSWTKDNTLIRKFSIGNGVKENPDPYFVVETEWDSVPKNTFDSLGFHNCFCNTLVINENEIVSSVKIYPNPVTNGSFTLESDVPLISVEVVNLLGKVIYRQEFTTQTEKFKFHLDNKLTGIFLVKIQLESGQSQTRKLIFQ
jgi:hypothetical protein